MTKSGYYGEEYYMLGKSTQFIFVDDPEEGLYLEKLEIRNDNLEKHYIAGTSIYYCEHPKCVNTFTFFNLRRDVLISLMAKKIIPAIPYILGSDEEYRIQCLGIQQRNKLIEAIEKCYNN